jgi:methylthioribose-1-phosphate isomerase
MRFETISYKNKRLRIIDQRLLPARMKKIEARTAKDVYAYIKSLAVRGAPAIGVFAAYGILIGANSIETNDKKQFFRELAHLAGYLKKSRPTAVNLFWAIDRMLKTADKNYGKGISGIKEALEDEARAIHREDIAMCERIGAHGAILINRHDRILTHCNAGFLATGGMGTALAIIYKASMQGKGIKVYVDETRPLLQGSRLTAWELKKRGIDVTLICDSMAAAVMSQGRIDKVIVGADRIARNGDTANKIGTYSLAVLARAHNIPFYVAAPSSTIDPCLIDGSGVPIEERPCKEIKDISGLRITPTGIKAYNPAFDVTPAALITAIITEKGISRHPHIRGLNI